MLLLITFLLGAMSISFLCSILESVLLSTPMSFVTMKEDEGYKPATQRGLYCQNHSRAHLPTLPRCGDVTMAYTPDLTKERR